MAWNNFGNWRIGNRDEIYSSSINAKGYLDDKFGLNSLEDKPTKFPSCSFPLWWKKMNGAKSYAIVMESYDTHKSCGLPYINWIALNIKENELFEDQSLIDWVKWKSSDEKEFFDDILWQGCNSSCGELYSENSLKQKFKNNLTKKDKSDSIADSCIYKGPNPLIEDGISVVWIYGLDVEAKELFFIDDFKTNKKMMFNRPYYIGDLYQGITQHIVGTWTLCFKYKKMATKKIKK